MELREYQHRCREAIYDWFARRSDPTLVNLPTGSGKSVCIADLIVNVLRDEPGEHVIVLSHRREILQQDATKLQALMPHVSLGIFSAGLGSKRLRQVTIAGIQSIVRAHQLPPFKLIIIDEAHLLPPSGDGMYRRVIARLLDAQPDARIVGFSATPFRSSGYLHEGPGALFAGICFEVPMRDLIAAGHLVPLVTKQTQTQADLTGVRIRGGEFVAGEAEAAMDKEELTRAAVEEICRYGEARKSWLIFCAGIAHAEHVCEALRRVGIDARCLFGHTETGARDRLLRDFKSQRLRALVSVSALTTGFDAPCTDLVAILRPIASSSLWVQCLGRGMRPSPETGKMNCLVLDFASCVARCGLVDDPIVPGRGRRVGERVAPVKICPTCRTAVAVGVRNCPECDYQWEIEEAKHAPVASTARVLSSADASADDTETLPVVRVAYRLHAKEGKPNSLRVDYQCGLAGTVSEWVCFEHDGFARRKAVRWWRLHARPAFDHAPDTVAEALERVGQLRAPKTIVTCREGKYHRVVRVAFDEFRNGTDGGQKAAENLAARDESPATQGEEPVSLLEELGI